MWVELNARLGLTALMHISALAPYAIYPFIIIIICKIVCQKYKNDKITKLHFTGQWSHICNLAFCVVKVPLYSYKQNQGHPSWDKVHKFELLSPLNVRSAIYWIQKAEKAYFVINVKHPIKSFLRLIHHRLCPQPVRSPFHSLKSLLPILYLFTANTILYLFTAELSNYSKCNLI